MLRVLALGAMVLGLLGTTAFAFPSVDANLTATSKSRVTVREISSTEAKPSCCAKNAYCCKIQRPCCR